MTCAVCACVRAVVCPNIQGYIDMLYRYVVGLKEQVQVVCPNSNSGSVLSGVVVVLSPTLHPPCKIVVL